MIDYVDKPRARTIKLIVVPFIAKVKIATPLI
jgi:hypothetical protein